MEIVRRTVATILISALLPGCVSSMTGADLDKYKGVTPDRLLSDQWYITTLSPRLFVFESALFEENQVRKMTDDLSGLCTASGGKIIHTTLSQDAIRETRQAISESRLRGKIRPTNHGSTVYDALTAERYFGHKLINFSSSRFVDESMKSYIKKSYFGRVSCSLDKGASWFADIVPGDVFTDSSDVVSLPVFVLTERR